jgi:hypothetical protein
MQRPVDIKAILYFPVTRIIVGLAACLGIGLLGMEGTHSVLEKTSIPENWKDPITGTVFAILVIVLYIQLYRRYENRKVTELSAARFPRSVISGILLGAALATLIILVQHLGHAYDITATRPFVPVLPNCWNTFVNAVVAEMLIVGIVFRISEDWLGTYLALAILVVLFFFLHITAPGATPVSALAVSMHAAFLLGPAFIFTRSLWFPIAIHFAWDFSFAAIYGASINGYTMDNSLFQSRIDGSGLLTGGYFGPQGSLQAALFCLIAGMIFIRASRRRGNIKPLARR